MKQHRGQGRKSQASQTVPASIYIGNSVSEDLLPATLVLAIGYGSQKKISTVLLEATPSRKLMEHPAVAPLLNDVEIIFLDEWSRAPLAPMRLFLLALAIPAALSLALRCSRKALVDQNRTWFAQQILHAVWDDALQSLPDGSTEISLSRRFRSALRVAEARQQARGVLRKFGPGAAFLGHTVYRGRAVLAEFRRDGVDIIAQAAGVFYRLPQNQDISWSTCSRPEWDSLLTMPGIEAARGFWSKRALGESTYEDARRAARGRWTDSRGEIENVLLLHIFRDSPFNAIDRTRIFADYVDWVRFSLETLAVSTESWAIKLHPSAERWGENQSIWIEAIASELFGPESKLNNVKIYDSSFSNLALLQGAKRVVTFGGTAHLEAACYGVRPIVIAEATLSSFDASLVCKPKSRDEYKRLLLAPSGSDEFRLAQPEAEAARKLLFLREGPLSLQADIGYLTRYRGDPEAIQEESLSRVLKQLPTVGPKLLELGTALARGLPRTVGFAHYERWSQARGLGGNSRKNNIPGAQ